MSSDDFLVENGIEMIIRRLDEIDSKTAILLYSRIDCNKSMKPISDQCWLKKNINEYYLDNSKKDSLEAYLKNADSIGAIFSYISCIIVLKSAWDEIKDSKYYYKSNYAHVYTLLKILKNNYNLLYTKDNLILCRMDNDSFSSGGILNRYLIDFNGYSKIINSIFYNDNNIKQLLYSIIRKEHGILRMMKIRVNCTSKKQWHEFVEIFKMFGYSSINIYICQNIYIFRKIIFLIISIRTKLSSQ
jgi:abequosyltransferase